jgi:hypothetical protein
MIKAEYRIQGEKQNLFYCTVITESPHKGQTIDLGHSSSTFTLHCMYIQHIRNQIKILRAQFFISSAFSTIREGFLAVQYGVAHGSVGVAVAPVLGRHAGDAGRGAPRRSRRLGKSPAGGPRLPAQRHEEAQVPEDQPPRCQERRRPPLAGARRAARYGGRRALRRVERRRRDGVRVCVASISMGNAARLAGEEVTGGQQRQTEVEGSVVRRPPHGEELRGVHVDERRGGAVERLAEAGVDDAEALEGRRHPRLGPEPPAARQAFAARVRRRGLLHGARERERER